MPFKQGCQGTSACLLRIYFFCRGEGIPCVFISEHELYTFQQTWACKGIFLDAIILQLGSPQRLSSVAINIHYVLTTQFCCACWLSNTIQRAAPYKQHRRAFYFFMRCLKDLSRFILPHMKISRIGEGEGRGLGYISASTLQAAASSKQIGTAEVLSMIYFIFPVYISFRVPLRFGEEEGRETLSFLVTHPPWIFPSWNYVWSKKWYSMKEYEGWQDHIQHCFPEEKEPALQNCLKECDRFLDCCFPLQRAACSPNQIGADRLRALLLCISRWNTSS